MPSIAQDEQSEATVLHLPASIVSVLSPDRYLLAHLGSDPANRPCGRRPDQFASLSISAGSLTHCLGSAVARSGGSAVVCGIQPEILLASDIADPPAHSLRATKLADRQRQSRKDLAHLQLLVPNVDLATGCSKDHIPGQAPGSTAQGLTQRLYRLLLSSGLVNLEDLAIYNSSNNDTSQANASGEESQVVAYYSLHIHLLVLSLDGFHSIISPLWAAMVAALHDLSLPRTHWDADADQVFCDDHRAAATRLSLQGLPTVLTWSVFAPSDDVRINDKQTSTWLLADPDSIEENVSNELVTVMVDFSDAGRGQPRVLNIEKLPAASGSTGIAKSSILDINQLSSTVSGVHAQQQWSQLQSALRTTGT